MDLTAYSIRNLEAERQRLEEEVKQLRAAAMIYAEVARRLEYQDRVAKSAA